MTAMQQSAVSLKDSGLVAEHCISYMQDLRAHPKKGSPAAAEAIAFAKWVLLLPAAMLQHAESTALRSGGQIGGEAARHLLHGWREAWSALYASMAS